jgi:hypothetical protein
VLVGHPARDRLRRVPCSFPVRPCIVNSRTKLSVCSRVFRDPKHRAKKFFHLPGPANHSKNLNWRPTLDRFTPGDIFLRHGPCSWNI